MTEWHQRHVEAITRPLTDAIADGVPGASWAAHLAELHIEQGQIPEARRAVLDFLDDSSGGGSVCG